LSHASSSEIARALASDTDWLARTASLFLELGLAGAVIEERAQEIAADRLRLAERRRPGAVGEADGLA